MDGRDSFKSKPMYSIMVLCLPVWYFLWSVALNESRCISAWEPPSSLWNSFSMLIILSGFLFLFSDLVPKRIFPLYPVIYLSACVIHQIADRIFFLFFFFFFFLKAYFCWYCLVLSRYLLSFPSFANIFLIYYFRLHCQSCLQLTFFGLFHSIVSLCIFSLSFHFFCFVLFWFGLVLWHVNHCWLLDDKSCFFLHIY